MDSHEQEGCEQEVERAKRERIRQLNDQLRRDRIGGRLFLTNGICRLRQGAMVAIVAAVAAFDEFSNDNDPYEEHDYGISTASGEPVIWKIDYYDRRINFPSSGPADSNLTIRVLTIVLAS